MTPLCMYLAGAIRDNHPEDIEWREYISSKLYPFIGHDMLRILSPLGGKSFDEKTGKWTISGVPSHAYHIVSQDFWSVDRADIIVFNMLPMAEGYQSIGTLTEWGRSTATQKLRYVILPQGFKGHKNLDMYQGPHPFIERNATEIFQTVNECVEFLVRHMPVLAGVDPRFDPYSQEARRIDEIVEKRFEHMSPKGMPRA